MKSTTADNHIELLAFSQKLVKLVKKDTEKRGFKFLLHNSAFVNLSPKVGCSGYFDETKKELVVATGKPIIQWITTLAHEYCHFLQWKEQCKAWTDLQIEAGPGQHSDAITVIDQFLAGDNFLYSYLDEAFKAAINVEFDCEKRTVELLKKMKAPINTVTYTQKALAYVLFYHECKVRRKWYDPLNPPYEVEEVWSKMPKNFRFNPNNPKIVEKLPYYDLCF